MSRMMATGISMIFAAATFAANLPPGWYPIGDAGMDRYLVDVIEDGGKNGAALRIRTQEEKAGSFGGVGQAISAANYRGNKVRVSAFLRTENVRDGYAGIWFRVDKGQEMLQLDNMLGRGVTGTKNWTKYESVLTVDASATRLIFGAILQGKGTLFADEFELEIVPDSTPETSASLPSKPRNLDF